MFPIVPFVMWVGGVAAGAQVAGGVVRGVGELVRGRPGSALIQGADGFAARVVTACKEFSKLGHDVYDAVMQPWSQELAVEQEEPVMHRHGRPRRRKSTDTHSADESVNGTAPATVQN